MKTKLVVLVMLAIILTGCGEIVANGQNYYCGSKSTLDIIQEDPPRVHFRCEGGTFDITFDAPPSEPELLREIRELNLKNDVGVVLENNEIIQLYHGDRVMMWVDWPEK